MPTLAQLNPADPSRGYSTPYYEAKTNSGDVAARFNAAAGQTVRLVDPKTGQVYASGTGPEGAQQIATLATQLGQDLGRKAQWQIQTDQGGGQFQTVGYDRYDPKKTGFLNTIIKIAAPLLGAAIPGLAPFLGAALGGFGGDLATGGNLKSALMSGAGAGLGNSLGGAFSSVLRGAPATFSGVNSLSGLGGALSGGGSGAIASGAGVDALAGGALGDALGTVAPVTVLGNAAPGLVSSGLAAGGGAVGQALATGVGAGGGANGQQQQPTSDSGPGSRQLTMGNGDFSQPLGGTAGPGVAGDMRNLAPIQWGTGDWSVPIGDILEYINVMGTPPAVGGILPPLTGYYDVPGLVGTDMAGINNSSFANQQTGQTVDKPPLLDPLDLAGNTAGGVAGDMITGGLAQLLGLMPKPDLTGLPDAGFEDATNPGPKGDDGLVPDTLGPKPVANTPGPAGGGTGGAGGNGMGGGGTAAAPGLLNTGAPSGAAAPSPATAGSDVDMEGGFAPDIYPWRKEQMV